MGFKAITKNTPAEEPPHILSEDDAAIYRGILGQDGVLNIGSKLKSTVISNNKVRVGDGVINVDGHIGRNAYADYEDLTIENGSAGKKRHDLIVASFSTTGSGGLDTYILKVIKGVAGDTGADPAVTKQDIYAGGKLREYPLYRVKLDGLSIVAVDQMFKVIPTVPELETKYNELNSTLKWSDWKTLGTNKLGIELRYRYNAYEVELHYKGTLKALGISGGSEGYIFPSLPEGLNPAMNIDHSIYACAGDNDGKLTLECYPTGTPSNFRITSHSSVTVSPEYICGVLRYTRG